MKTITLLITVFVLLLTAGVNAQQGSISAFILQVNLNYNNSVLELSGEDYISENIHQGKTFGAGKGFGASVISKLRLGKNGLFNFKQRLSFNRFLSNDFGKTQYDIGEADYNAFSFGTGIDYNFTPGKKYIISGGVELIGSLINGKSKIWFQRLGHPAGDSVDSYTFSSSLRLGFGINLGAEYIINSSTGLNFGISYQNLNAFIKQADGKYEDDEFPIRDENSNGLIFAGTKNFAFISLHVGISLYFGMNK